MLTREDFLLQREGVAGGLSVFQRSGIPEKAAEATEQADEESAFGRIRCPLCQWQPNASSIWHCGDVGHPEYFFDGCGMEWNTFATGGRCPGCGHQWQWTSCLRCEGWSLHHEWYAEKPS